MPDPDNGSSEKIALDKPVTRATYRDHYLPLIFVDRPAWGAALLNPGRVTGLANVNEAQFRIALLDRNDKVLVDVPVLASCGTGCWGTFDVTLSYHVSSGPVGNAAGLGHLGVQRQAGSRARISGLSPARAMTMLDVRPIGRHAALRADPLEWLLERRDPAVRHLALRQLLDRPADDPDVADSRRAAMAADPIASMLAAQEPAGYWQKPGPGYATKYRGTVWQLDLPRPARSRSAGRARRSRL